MMKMQGTIRNVQKSNRQKPNAEVVDIDIVGKLNEHIAKLTDDLNSEILKNVELNKQMIKGTVDGKDQEQLYKFQETLKQNQQNMKKFDVEEKTKLIQGYDKIASDSKKAYDTSLSELKAKHSDKLTKLQSENDRLKRQNQKQAYDGRSASLKMLELEGQIKTLRSQAVNSKSLIEELERANVALNNRQVQKSKYRSDMAQMRNLIATMQEANSKTIENGIKNQKQIKNYKSEIDKLTTQRTNLSKKNEQLNRSVAVCENKYKLLAGLYLALPTKLVQGQKGIDAKINADAKNWAKANLEGNQDKIVAFCKNLISSVAQAYNTKLTDVTNQLQTLKTTAKDQKQKRQKKQKQIKELIDNVSKNESKVKQNQGMISQLIKTNDQLSKKLTSSETQNKNFDLQVRNAKIQLTKKNEEWTNKFNNKSAELSSAQQTIKTKQREYTTLQSKLNDANANASAAARKASDLAVAKQQQYSSDIARVQNQLSAKSQQLQASKSLVSDLRRQIDILKGQITDLGKKIVNAQKQIKQKGQRFVLLTQELQTANQKLADANREIDRRMKEINNSNQQNRRTVQSFNLAIDRVNNQKVSLRGNLQILSNGLNDISQKYLGHKFQIDLQNINDRDLNEVVSDIMGSYDKLQFFNGSELISRGKIDFIKNMFKTSPDIDMRHIESTKLLMKMETNGTLNAAQFHKFVDRKESIFVAIKLETGTIIGGYSQIALQPEKQERFDRGKGFIFSLTREKIFNMRREANNKQPVYPYDEFNFLMGTAQLRINNEDGKAKFYSNIGVNPSCFQASGFNRSMFYGVTQTTNRLIVVQEFQVWQIFGSI